MRRLLGYVKSSRMDQPPILYTCFQCSRLQEVMSGGRTIGWRIVHIPVRGVHSIGEYYPNSLMTFNHSSFPKSGGSNEKLSQQEIHVRSRSPYTTFTKELAESIVLYLFPSLKRSKAAQAYSSPIQHPSPPACQLHKA
jgi:hypothetical protein